MNQMSYYDNEQEGINYFHMSSQMAIELIE